MQDEADRRLDLDVIDFTLRSAVDASAFSDLMAAWERKLDRVMATPRGLPGGLEPELVERLASIERWAALQSPQPSDDPVAEALSRGGAPAVATNLKGVVIAANPAAVERLGVAVGATLPDALIDPESQEAWRTLATAMRTSANQTHAILRLSDGDGRRLIAEAYGLTPPGGAPPALIIRTLNIDWSRSVGAWLSDAFGLTDAEVDVCRLFLQSGDIQEVATARNARPLTVKTQLHAIYAKTDVRSQVELIRLLGLLALRAESVRKGLAGWSDPFGRALSLTDKAGRRIAATWCGDPSGAPLVIVHTSATGYRLGPVIERRLASAGFRLWAFSRPGFGDSDPRPGCDPVEAAADALGCVVRHVAKGPVSLIALSAGLIPALAYARANPGAVARILVIGGCLPIHDPDSIAALPPNQRTFFHLVAHFPWLARQVTRAGLIMVRHKGPDFYLRRVYERSPLDLETIGSDAAPYLYSAVDHLFAQGVDAFIDDIRLMLSPWEAAGDGGDPPVHFILGEAERNYPPAAVADLANRTPGWTSEIIPGVAELMIFQKPDAIAGALLAALAPMAQALAEDLHFR